jgi:hypothetical protein
VLAAEGIEMPADRLSTSDASDEPLPQMVRIEPDAWHWRQDRLVRRALADGIEMAADRIEFTLPTVVSRAETAVRSSVRLTAAKIAATLRKYAVDVGLGGVESDQTVPPKITSALVAVAWGRWDALAIEDPQPVVERFLKRFGLRIISPRFSSPPQSWVPSGYPSGWAMRPPSSASPSSPPQHWALPKRPRTQ